MRKLHFLRNKKPQTQLENPPSGVQIAISPGTENVPATASQLPAPQSPIKVPSNHIRSTLILLVVVCVVGVSALAGAAALLLRSSPTLVGLKVIQSGAKAVDATSKHSGDNKTTLPTKSTVPTTQPATVTPAPASSTSHANTPSTTAPSSQPSLSQSPLYDGTWTGYELRGSANDYTMVEGTVVVPKITCPSTTQDAQFSLWVGFDGADGGNTVEQEGIRAMCDTGNCVSNCQIQPDYYIWTEAYPAALYEQNLAISPGDTIFMQVSYIPSNGEYEMYFANKTTSGPNATFTTYLSCPSGSVCPRSTAEWMTENHLDQGTLVSLFGSAAFSGAEVSTAGNPNPTPFTNYTNYPIEAVDSGQQLESVSNPLNQGVTGFTINQLVSD